MNHVNRRIEINNLRKLDATEPFVFEVTASDVKNGKFRDPCRCVFSAALRRTDKRCVGATVYKSVAWLEFRNGTAVRYIVPPTLSQAIYTYDVTLGKAAPEPGTYYLAPPSPTVRLGRVKRKTYEANTEGNIKHPRQGRMAMHRHTIVRKFSAKQSPVKKTPKPKMPPPKKRRHEAPRHVH
jgi:hypothetical protein